MQDGAHDWKWSCKGQKKVAKDLEVLSQAVSHSSKDVGKTELVLNSSKVEVNHNKHYYHSKSGKRGKPVSRSSEELVLQQY